MDSVYQRRPWRWFFRKMLSLPVKTDGGPSVGALRAALGALEQGQLVGVFPEGRVITGAALGRVHPGAAMLAVRAQAPVVPMVIRGSERAWPHGRSWPGPARVSVSVGPPIAPPFGSGREAVQKLLRRIEAALLELSRRGAR
jgi:1-acyl-sn-glycerol-3-phosphate acyltransferase